MRDGKCPKYFPKNFNEFIRELVNEYPKYKKSNNGISVDIKGKSLDNHYVVP